METTVTVNKSYSVTIHRQACKERYGVSVNVTGDRLVYVKKQAKELLEQAIIDADAVQAKYEAVKPNESQN